jgi:hypothetical protein
MSVQSKLICLSIRLDKAITRQAIVLCVGAGINLISQDMDLKNPFFGCDQTLTAQIQD